MLVNVPWMAMDPGTRSHVSRKLDASSDVEFKTMKEAVMRHTTLVGATSGGGAISTVAMGIGSIASVTDTAQNPIAGEPPAADWGRNRLAHT